MHVKTINTKSLTHVVRAPCPFGTSPHRQQSRPWVLQEQQPYRRLRHPRELRMHHNQNELEVRRLDATSSTVAEGGRREPVRFRSLVSCARVLHQGSIRRRAKSKNDRGRAVICSHKIEPFSIA